jgi:4-hydroxybenzoyl-CoA thioesterase
VSILFSGDGRDRLRATVVLVCMDLTTQRAIEWPPELRERMMASLVPA